jgi:uncharacterized phiE125 gp8 family phage protein
MWYGQTISDLTEPVTLVEAKAQCRVDHDGENDKIELLIPAARQHAEKYCGQSFAKATLVAKATDWADLARLPTRPITSIAIAYVDGEGVERILPSGNYTLIERAVVPAPGGILPRRAPGSAITVTLAVGDACPAAVKQAILLRVQDLWEARGSTPDAAPSSFDSLLCNHRY